MIRDPVAHDASGEPFAVTRRRPAGEVSAVGAAGDPYALRIGQPLLDQEVDSRQHVIEFRTHAVALVPFREGDPPTGAPAVVGVENGVASARRHLTRHRVRGQPAVLVVRLGTAVSDHDRGNPLPLPPLRRMNQQALDLETVARTPPHDLLPAEAYLREPRVRVGQTHRSGTPLDPEREHLWWRRRRLGDECQPTPPLIET